MRNLSFIASIFFYCLKIHQNFLYFRISNDDVQLLALQKVRIFRKTPLNERNIFINKSPVTFKKYLKYPSTYLEKMKEHTGSYTVNSKAKSKGK